MSKVMEKPARRTSIGAQRNPASEEAILVAADEILRENGLSGFSIEAVAKRAKAGKPTIYRWWPSRTALLLDVYHRQKHDMPIPDTGNVRQDFFVFLRGLIDFWRRDGGTVFRSIIAEAQGDEVASTALADYMVERRKHCATMVSRARDRGEVRADVDPDVIQEILSAYAWSRLLTDRLDTPDSEIEAVADAILVGIRA